jgi:hypothetical protein
MTGAVLRGPVRPSPPDLHRQDVAIPPPAGVTWTMIGTRRMDRLVLPIEGRRSIHTVWPPGSFCDHCGVTATEGYVGPVTGDRALFPSCLLRRVCEPCARAWLRLEPDELSGHICTDRCTDRLHLELVDLETPAAPGAGGCGSIVGADGGTWSTAGAARSGRSDGLAGVGVPAGPAGGPGDLGTLGEVWQRRGWRIVDVTAPPRPWASSDGRRVAIWLEAARPLPWPVVPSRAQLDPWVW